MIRRSVFFVSDRTGITAEALGKSLLSQFEAETFEKRYFPYVDHEKKMQQLIDEITRVRFQHGVRPIVFSTLIDAEFRTRLRACDALIIDLFHVFIEPLEKELAQKSASTVGKTHGLNNDWQQKEKVNAIHYALQNDDGGTCNYADAQIILVGVSRSGKTPTSLYLALQYGLKVANYPITEDDLARLKPPALLMPYVDKLYGLFIQAERLHKIRQERRPNSTYASLAQCQYETRHVASLFAEQQIPYLDVTAMSIEETATTLVHRLGLRAPT